MMSKIEERLWSYIDNRCSDEERKLIAQLLHNNQEWKEKYNAVLQVNQIMQENIELEEPSMRFTKNIMEEISKLQIAPATRSYVNKKIIYSIATFFITVIAVLLVFGFAQINWSTTANISSPIDFSKWDFSKYLNHNFINLILLINLLLGLILLDRYLVKQKNKLSHKEV